MADNQRPVWHNRFGYLIQEVFDYLEAIARYHRENVVVRGIPTLDGPHRVVYRFGVRGEPIPAKFVEDLRDILGRARSVLDIAMFDAATAQASPALTESQQRATYFPLATSEQAWKSMAGQPHMVALSANQQHALQAMQPFVTGDDAASWFHEVQNHDKHRRPLVLSLIPDPEFIMLFNYIEPPSGSAEWWIDWVEPLPAVSNRVEFVEYRSAAHIKSAGIEDVPVAPAIWVDNGWRDVQHLLWHVLEFTSRGCAALGDGVTSLADSFHGYFTARRDQLAAFKKMMLTRDPEAERKWMSLSGMELPKTGQVALVGQGIVAKTEKELPVR